MELKLNSSSITAFLSYLKKKRKKKAALFYLFTEIGFQV